VGKVVSLLVSSHPETTKLKVDRLLCRIFRERINNPSSTVLEF
jgi:hypothetical protein